tara:strand:+ start:131 stop:448 length:318 start_codon:yes stop_codon:yes gene_type:complete
MKKELKYSIIGGIIGFILGFISLFVVFFICGLAGIENIFCTILGFIPYRIFGFILDIKFISESDFLESFILVFEYILIGALIGWIIGKRKSKKQSNSSLNNISPP